MSRFLPVARGTGYLLRPFFDDWLPEDHIARFVHETDFFMGLHGLQATLHATRSCEGQQRMLLRGDGMERWHGTSEGRID